MTKSQVEDLTPAQISVYSKFTEEMLKTMGWSFAARRRLHELMDELIHQHVQTHNR